MWSVNSTPKLSRSRAAVRSAVVRGWELGTMANSAGAVVMTGLQRSFGSSAPRAGAGAYGVLVLRVAPPGVADPRRRPWLDDADGRDRKSTRLNSSHVAISYAVFCLKKNK